jgi:hypothetical protein
LREVRYFAERLVEHEMPLGAFVVNRLHVAPRGAQAPATVAQAATAIHASGLDDALGEDGPPRVARAHADAFALAELDARNMKVIDEFAARAPLVRVPELPSDVHDIGLLARLADTLTGKI